MCCSRDRVHDGGGGDYMAAGGGHPIQSITPKKISMRDCPGQAACVFICWEMFSIMLIEVGIVTHCGRHHSLSRAL